MIGVGIDAPRSTGPCTSLSLGVSTFIPVDLLSTRVLVISFLSAVVASAWPWHGEHWLTMVGTAIMSTEPCAPLSLGVDVFTYIADVMSSTSGVLLWLYWWILASCTVVCLASLLL